MKLYAAIFYTKNMDRVVEFYESVIGLPKAFRQGNIYSAFMLDDDTQLGIKQATEAREIPGGQTAIIKLENIEQLYEAFQAKKVVFHKELEKATWGATFSVLDPDGNKLEFVDK